MAPCGLPVSVNANGFKLYSHTCSARKVLLDALWRVMVFRDGRLPHERLHQDTHDGVVEYLDG